MKTLKSSLLLFGGLLMLATSVRAEDAAVILSRQVGPYMEALNSFKQTANFSYKIFEMQGDAQKGKDAIDQISSGGYPIVVTIGTEATILAKNTPDNIQVIYSMVLTAVDFGKKTVNGVYIKIPVERQFEQMQKIFPARKRIGVVYGMQYSSEDIAVARKTAEKSGIKLIPLAMETQEQLPNALSKLDKNAVDLIWMVADALVSDAKSVEMFIRHSQTQGIPLIGCSVFQVKAGVLAAFSADYRDIGVQTKDMVLNVRDKKMSGKVEGPRKIVIYLNPEVQKRMGITDFNMTPDVQLIQ